MTNSQIFGSNLGLTLYSWKFLFYRRAAVVKNPSSFKLTLQGKHISSFIFGYTVPMMCWSRQTLQQLAMDMQPEEARFLKRLVERTTVRAVVSWQLKMNEWLNLILTTQPEFKGEEWFLNIIWLPPEAIYCNILY